MQRINWVTALFLIFTPLVAVVWGGAHIAVVGLRAIDVGCFAAYLAATEDMLIKAPLPS